MKNSKKDNIFSSIILTIDGIAVLPQNWKRKRILSKEYYYYKANDLHFYFNEIY